MTALRSTQQVADTVRLWSEAPSVTPGLIPVIGLNRDHL